MITEMRSLAGGTSRGTVRCSIGSFQHQTREWRGDGFMHGQVSEEKCQILCNNRSVKYRIWLSDEILLALTVADARALFEMLLEMA